MFASLQLAFLWCLYCKPSYIQWKIRIAIHSIHLYDLFFKRTTATSNRFIIPRVLLPSFGTIYILNRWLENIDSRTLPAVLNDPRQTESLASDTIKIDSNTAIDGFSHYLLNYTDAVLRVSYDAANDIAVVMFYQFYFFGIFLLIVLCSFFVITVDWLCADNYTAFLPCGTMA